MQTTLFRSRLKSGRLVDAVQCTDRNGSDVCEWVTGRPFPGPGLACLTVHTMSGIARPGLGDWVYRDSGGGPFSVASGRKLDDEYEEAAYLPQEGAMFHLRSCPVAEQGATERRTNRPGGA